MKILEAMHKSNADNMLGVLKDFEFHEGRLDRHREDISRYAARTRKVDQRTNTTEETVLLLQQEIAAMKGRLCHCGDARRESSLEDLAAAQDWSRSTSPLSYLTPPQATGPLEEIREESPEALMIRDPSIARNSDEENIPELSLEDQAREAEGVEEAERRVDEQVRLSPLEPRRFRGTRRIRPYVVPAPLGDGERRRVHDSFRKQLGRKSCVARKVSVELGGAKSTARVRSGSRAASSSRASPGLGSYLVTAGLAGAPPLYSERSGNTAACRPRGTPDRA